MSGRATTLASWNVIVHVYRERSVPSGSNLCSAVMRNGHVGLTLRYVTRWGGSHVVVSLVPLIGMTPSRPRMVKRVPTPMGSESGFHIRTAGSITGAISGELTAAKALAGGAGRTDVLSTIVVRTALRPRVMHDGNPKHTDRKPRCPGLPPLRG